MAAIVLPEDVRAEALAHGAVRYAAPTGETYLVVHHDGADRVFLNRCPHRRLPLDRGGRVLYSPDRQWLVCGNHGAKFNPLTGQCVAGPCAGKSLQLVSGE
jgi:nitrite reductase/ring-hydroxylating ferredoxin subunit